MGSAKHRYGQRLGAYLTAAVITGAVCVWFARGFEWVLHHRLDFHTIGAWCWLTTPVLFTLSVWLLRRFAPYASGTGIPQTLFAAEHFRAQNERQIAPLFSLKTILWKTLTLYIAVAAGASTGREGPTVHVAAGVFFAVLWLSRRYFKVEFDGRSALIAGGAAGLAAAFNTPLAGVTFALEELSEQYFSSVKEIALMAIIVAAITAQVLTGEYGYFGHLREPAPLPILDVLLLSALVGGAGLCFSVLIRRGAQVWKNWFRAQPALLPVMMGLALMALSTMAGTAATLGPGNNVAQSFLEGQDVFSPWTFAPTKMLSTLFTYWAGLSGGIFAPCLSMGAGFGATLAGLLHWSSPSCALVGMAAFLSGTIQAPMTSFVIIFEMTGHHTMLLPIMVASLIPFVAARFLEIPSLYKQLAEDYAPILEEPAPPAP